MVFEITNSANVETVPVVPTVAKHPIFIPVAAKQPPTSANPVPAVVKGNVFRGDDFLEIQRQAAGSHNLKLMFEEGKIPLGRWEEVHKKLSKVFSNTFQYSLFNAKEQILKTEESIVALERQLQEAKKQLVLNNRVLKELEDEKSKYKDINITVFEQLCMIDKEVQSSFDQRTSSPTWAIDDMTFEDFSIVMSNFKLEHLILSLKEMGIDSMEFLTSQDPSNLAEIVPEEDLMQVLYCAKLAENQIFYPGKHSEKGCVVCSSDLTHLMTEYHFPTEAIDLATAQSLTIEQLVSLPGSVLWKSLSLKVKLLATKASSSLQKCHQWSLE